MKNNLQANLLIESNLNYFKSEPISLSKKSIKALKNGSWIKIDQDSLNVVIDSKKTLFKGKLFSSKEYLLIEKNRKIKKLKNSKENFTIKYYFDKELFNTTTAVVKMPISAIMYKGKKEFAKVELFITDNIFIEIKELL